MEPLGVYIHVPFCRKKCDYCDFYSVENGESLYEEYEKAVLKTLSEYGEKLGRDADTLYFGGGTPSLLPVKSIKNIIDKCREYFSLQNAEITLECNPSTVYDGFFESLALAGVNRISLGLQSANDLERKSLGRLSTVAEAEKAVRFAQNAGISNISLDLMLGIPFQTAQSVKDSVDFIGGVGAKHASAYVLKAEKNTPLYARKDSLPDEDAQADMYLAACECFENAGFRQYEISNFCKTGFESRHNLKYWRDEEYLGIGPAAHSYISGKRFFYPRDIKSFISGKPPVDDGFGGDYYEYAMLRLRLSEGLGERDLIERFGVERSFSESAKEKINFYAKQNLLTFDGDTVRLTKYGFLVSNSLIAEIIE